MRVLWVLGTHKDAFGPSDDPGVIARSPVASDRLRVALPAIALAPLGVDSAFCALEPGVPRPAVETYDTVVIGKFSAPARGGAARVAWWLDFARSVLDAGRRLVVDVSDHPFEGAGPRVAFYRDMLPACSAVSVPSDWLARAIAGACGSLPRVVADPYEGPPAAPQFAPADPVRLLWFGHALNLHYLQALVPGLVRLSTERALALEVVSDAVQGIETAFQRLTRKHGPRFAARYRRWSLETMPKALAGCDMVLIPSDAADAKKAGASANRLVETLVAGRLAVASPLEAYLPYADCALLDADLIAGLRAAWQAPREMESRIRRGQRRVAERHAPEVIARQWLGVLQAP